MSSSLLNNFSLGLVEGLPDSPSGLELSDEVTQILFGSLEGLADEVSQVRAAGSFFHTDRTDHRSPVHDLDLDLPGQV